MDVELGMVIVKLLPSRDLAWRRGDGWVWPDAPHVGGLGPVLAGLDEGGGGGVGGSGSGVAELVSEYCGEVVAAAWGCWLACGSGSVVGVELEDGGVGESESVVVWSVVGLDG